MKTINQIYARVCPACKQLRSAEKFKPHHHKCRRCEFAAVHQAMLARAQPLPPATFSHSPSSSIQALVARLHDPESLPSLSIGQPPCSTVQAVRTCTRCLRTLPVAGFPDRGGGLCLVCEKAARQARAVRQFNQLHADDMSHARMYAALPDGREKDVLAPMADRSMKRARVRMAAIAEQQNACQTCACCGRLPKGRRPQVRSPRLLSSGPLCWQCLYVFCAVMYRPAELAFMADWLQTAMQVENVRDGQMLG